VPGLFLASLKQMLGLKEGMSKNNSLKAGKNIVNVRSLLLVKPDKI
jgi:hypothetical protein